ncbi:MAG: YfhO family protein, partial [Clostridia bacterium]|nr:YfhO family protein [Clostridia bacterium]
EHKRSVLDETYDVPTFTEDCKTLKSHACQSFEYGKDSFTAQITLPAGGDKLVFFSVPYESGWTAEINGEPVEVLPVNIGFMAVKAKAGTLNNIVFKYRTPGLYEGAIVTLVCIILYFVYIAVSAKYGKLKPRMRLKKTYRVAAVGSDEEIGRRYKELRLGYDAMKRKPLPKSDNDSQNDDAENNIDNVDEIDNTAAADIDMSAPAQENNSSEASDDGGE